MYTALFQERKVRTNFVEPFPKQNKTKMYFFLHNFAFAGFTKQNKM